MHGDDIARAAGRGASTDAPATIGTDARFAVYFAPTGALDAIGRLWLGRDADSGQMLPRDWIDRLTDETGPLRPYDAYEASSTSTVFDVPDAFDVSDVSDAALDDAKTGYPPLSAALLDGWTGDPRRYGLHATLKPPFRLAADQSAAALDAALRTLAASMQPFVLPLALGALRGFLAWRPADAAVASGPLQALADACVRELDRFRAPPSAAERARRLAKDDGAARHFSARERDHLERWGYPYVFDTFEFHITLTQRLAPDVERQARRALAALALHLERSGQAGCLAALHGVHLPIDAISIFFQATADAPFVAARHYRFDGSVRDGAAAAIWEAARVGQTGARDGDVSGAQQV